MQTDSPVLLVKAIHNFKGSNNDELCLTKGDVITVTQALDGGWWEGTLNGITGWFPSNYVKELKQESEKSGVNNDHSVEVPLSPNLNDMRMYRAVVFQDIVDTEKNFLSELQSLVTKYLRPLKETDILNDVEYSQLLSNLEEVYTCNKALLSLLEDLKVKPSKLQRIGGAFMQIALLIKNINLKYCAEHPKAVTVIEKHKDALEKFMEEHGASPPGILVLTTGLSKPFRRLEKYPALLQELQRHTPENHVDRGDTQRAVSIFRDIATASSNIRRQKEMEIEIMTGNIRGWEGEAIQTLGNIIHMSAVVFLTEDQEKKDRYLVLFAETLLVLSISSRMSAFIYEGKLPLSGITIRRLNSSEGHQHAFEINGSMIQRIIVICSSLEALNQWFNVLQGNNMKTLSPISGASPRTSARYSPSHMVQLRTSPSPNSQLQNTHHPVHQINNTSTEEKPFNPNRIAVAARQVTKKVWPNWNLRPHPPLRANLTSQNEVKLRRSNSCKKERDRELASDMLKYQVRDTLSPQDRTRNTMPSATASAPPSLNFEEEKIIIDDLDGDCTEVKEKTLVDTVYMLKDQVTELKMELSSIRKILEAEREERRKLEMLVKKHMLPYEDHLDG